MSLPNLSKVEQAIIDILADHPSDEVPSQELRRHLRSRGFRRSAPALVFTMMQLEDKGLVCSREVVDVVGSIEVSHRYYHIPLPGQFAGQEVKRGPR